ncbi:MAG TPA: hypothetical protein VIH69_05025 [Dehalococcoidia bacterium]
MSTRQITTLFARLPYTEMCNLASAIAIKFPGIEIDHMAKALVELADQKALTELEEMEQGLLKKVFNRKRTITVQQHGIGLFVISCPTLHNCSVSTTDIRKGLSELLDQLVALETIRH